MKKLRFLVAVALISCLMTMNVFAADGVPYDAGGKGCQVGLVINGGTGTAQVSYTGTADISNVNFYVYLQKNNGDGWENHMGWIVSSNGPSAYFDRSASVAEGYTYRVEVHAFVYSSNGNFDFYIYSNEVSY